MSARTGPITEKAKILAIVVAALGYFVDIFDLLLFAIVRVDSLKSLGVAADQLKPVGLWLDNYLQVTGLVIGGIVWGVLGDRRGRLSVLFGSILVYSIANILNAFISDVPNAGFGALLHSLGLGSAINQYGALRFIAGFGLAGELGAGITLVSELVSKERRGLATTAIATVGICGAIAAYFITRVVEWRTAFLIGGIMGLALLFLRIGVVESGLFRTVQEKQVRGRGAVWLLFTPWSRLRRYLAVIVCAIPIWYAVGILIKYSDAIGASMGMPEGARPTPGLAIMWCYVGLAFGDLASGLLSQWLKSRRKALLVFHALSVLSIAAYFIVGPLSLELFYGCAIGVGFTCGYWAVFVTVVAEQFGTNLRATATTSAPNMVRWSAAGSAFLWASCEKLLGNTPASPWQAAMLVGALVIPLAIVSVFFLRETYGRDLHFTEDEMA
ncbi:MAG: MFS transporter [Phycisphaerales bacterium]|nr:MFS transporter [Phycisphaerales bacterium]